MKPKLNKTLELLHENLAVELLNKVKSGEATASEMNVARQFLKDNGIEGLPVDNLQYQIAVALVLVILNASKLNIKNYESLLV